MTEADLLRCIEAVDKRREKQEVLEDKERDKTGKFKPRASSDACGKSAKKTAEIVGTSQAKVERTRTVLSDPKEREAVMAGEKSSRALNEIHRLPGAPEADLLPTPTGSGKDLKVPLILPPGAERGARVPLKVGCWGLPVGQGAEYR
jgi:hypothetical protein